LAYSQYI